MQKKQWKGILRALKHSNGTKDSWFFADLPPKRDFGPSCGTIVRNSSIRRGTPSRQNCRWPRSFLRHMAPKWWGFRHIAAMWQWGIEGSEGGPTPASVRTRWSHRTPSVLTYSSRHRLDILSETWWYNSFVKVICQVLKKYNERM